MWDVHAHYFGNALSFSEDFFRQAQRARGGASIDLLTDYTAYWKNASFCRKVVVFGGKARRSGLWVDDAEISQFVSSDPRKYIGFMSLDPTQPDWIEEMKFGHGQLGLRGIKLMSMYAGFYPQQSSIDGLWAYAEKYELPVLLHTGTTFISQAPLDCTLPRHIDDVAIRFPGVRIIMAHLGHPYEGECVSVIRKHPNVYADVSALHYRPWQLFHSLMLVQEYGVWNKILFGSDFPFTTVDDSVAGLRRLSEIEISGFRLDREKLEAMIYCETGSLLGLE